MTTVSPTIGLPRSSFELPLDERGEVALGAGQDAVERLLEAGAAARDGRVADDVRGEPALRIAAEVERLAVPASRRRLRASTRPGREDQPAADLELGDTLDLVVLAGREAGSRPRLPVRRRRRRARRSAPSRPTPTRSSCAVHVGAVRTGTVRDEQEQREHHEVREDARAAVGDERERDAGERDERGGRRRR